MANSTDIRFILIFPETPSDGNFFLKDLPGSGKRIDIVCRSLAACFDWGASSQAERNLELVVTLSNDVLLKINAPNESYGKGETWWASHIQRILRNGIGPNFMMKEELNLEDYLSTLVEADERILVLEENGSHLSVYLQERAPQYSFMLGNHEGFNRNTTEVIRKLEIPSVSLGAFSYLGSHCIARVISEFERLEL